MPNNIFDLVAIVLGRKPDLASISAIQQKIPDALEADGIALIKHHLHNHETLTADLQKYLPVIAQEHESAVKSWDGYLKKLEQALALVKYRKDNNYEQQDIMPTQQELAELQQDCLRLTEAWYGPSNGNISCFYKYFIDMSNIAGITAFAYQDITKYISQDHYLVVVDKDERKNYYSEYDKKRQALTAEGVPAFNGKSVIDKGVTNNIFFYTQARQILYHEYAKEIIVADLKLANYGQLSYAKRAMLWQLIQENYAANSDHDKQNIFCQYVGYLHDERKDFYRNLMQHFTKIDSVDNQTIYDIVKLAGLQSGNLIAIDRLHVDNLLPRRHLDLAWHRKFPLENIVPANTLERTRILPNDFPYAPTHGLSVCADGHLDNMPRDVEKLFCEFKMLCPSIRNREKMPGEVLVNMFHNSFVYSSVQATQHTHIACGTIEQFNLYNNLVGVKSEIDEIGVEAELVQVGTLLDAMYLKIYFDSLENTKLIQFLLNLNKEIFLYFGGHKAIDVYLHLFITEAGKYVFIYQPHAYLTQINPDKFLNPENDIVSSRKPQFFLPSEGVINYFSNESVMANGLEYCRKFFDAIYKPGVYTFIANYLRQYTTKL